jgi:hypothetical protein
VNLHAATKVLFSANQHVKESLVSAVLDTLALAVRNVSVKLHYFIAFYVPLEVFITMFKFCFPCGFLKPLWAPSGKIFPPFQCLH